MVSIPQISEFVEVRDSKAKAFHHSRIEEMVSIPRISEFVEVRDSKAKAFHHSRIEEKVIFVISILIRV